MLDKTINFEVTMPDPPKAARRFANGDEILGRYVVQAELGQGGMGVVYRCFDKIGGVEVAVKGLPPEVSHNADEMEAVRDNFQLVSELHHPNIAGVRTLEKDAATGDYYLVMTLARGVSLRHWLRQHGGREHRAEQLNVLRQIASALDYAHNAEPKHIIHRDIKPENVMVDERGNAAVLDFGLAAQVRSSLSRVSQVVTSRSGTPAYKSPEQWLAQAQRAPSDQYSLGVIAYQMFAGELPYDSDDIEILKHAVVFDPVPPISGETKSINAVFAKVLAKKPQERFASCAAFVDELGRARTPAAPSRRGFAAVLLGVLAVAALVGGSWWWQERAKSEELRVKNEVLSAERAESDRTAVTPAAVPVVPAVPEVSPAPKPVVDADADRRRQEEVAKLATTRTKISIKVAAAKDDYAKVAPYRSEKEGFESHLSEIDRQWETVEGVQNPKTLAEAEKTLASVAEAADVIAFELNWLVTNRDGRDAAKRIEKEIADELEAKLREFKADDVAKSKYDKGQSERKTAAQALARGEFASARRQYEAAKATLAAAIADARQFHIKTALVVANEYKTAERWQNCINETQKVLGWEPQSAEALALKQEAESHLGPKPGEEREFELVNGVKMKFCWCPAGKFSMGSDDGDEDEKPVHEVTLKDGFWMGKYQVTQRQWASIIRELGPIKNKDGNDIKANPSWFSSEGGGNDRVSGLDTSDFPVENVSWDDCDCIIRALNASRKDGLRFSLPTEAQWEYAAKEGAASGSYRYAGGDDLDALGWYYENSGVSKLDDSSWDYDKLKSNKCRPHSVREKDVGNSLGIVGMSGNVWEWCLDWYDKDYYAQASSDDPTGPASGAVRVYRGGCWDSCARDCCSSDRDGYGPGCRYYDLGFRLCCSAGPRR